MCFLENSEAIQISLPELCAVYFWKRTQEKKKIKGSSCDWCLIYLKRTIQVWLTAISIGYCWVWIY